MIKPEKTRKIGKKKPKNFPKNPKNLPARFAPLARGGLPAAKLGGYFPKKNFPRGGILAIPPPLAMSA